MKNNNFRYSRIDSGAIYSDPTYQRNVDFARVRNIVEHFNSNLVNLIKVSKRDEKYYVFDGQHTLAALKMRNGNKDILVDCKVYSGLSQQDEAILFSEQNGLSRNVDICAKMKALYISNDTEITELRNAIESVGIRFDFTKAKTPNKIVACAAIQKIFKNTEPNMFKEILHITCSSWNREAESFSKEMLMAVYLFCKTYNGEYKVNKAIEQFGKLTPRIIIREGKSVTNNGDVRFARQLVHGYNRKLRTGRLDENKIERN